MFTSDSNIVDSLKETVFNSKAISINGLNEIDDLHNSRLSSQFICDFDSQEFAKLVSQIKSEVLAIIRDDNSLFFPTVTQPDLRLTGITLPSTPVTAGTPLSFSYTSHSARQTRDLISRTKIKQEKVIIKEK